MVAVSLMFRFDRIGFFSSSGTMGSEQHKGRITLPLSGLYHSIAKVGADNTSKMGTPCFAQYRIDGDTDAYPISQKHYCILTRDLVAKVS